MFTFLIVNRIQNTILKKNTFNFNKTINHLFIFRIAKIIPQFIKKEMFHIK